MSMPLAMFSSVFFIGYMQKHRDYKKFLIMAGVVRIVAGASILIVQNAWQFILAIWIFQLPQGIIKPAQNFILSKNYPHGRRGKRFGVAISAMNLSALLGSFAAGALLDFEQQYFRYIFVAIGISGGLGSFILGSIPTPLRKVKSLAKPFHNMITIFRNNPQFWRFERNFFIYGFAFLLIGPIIPIFLVDILNMTYTEVSISRGVLSMLGLVLFAPFSGRIHDKYDPFKFSGRSFAILSLFPFLLLISSFTGKFVAYSAFIARSLAMAGVAIIWNLGSIAFSDFDDEAIYQSIHLTMTGIRGFCAPLFGLLTLSLLGYNWTFSISTVIFLIASFLMFKESNELKESSGLDNG